MWSDPPALLSSSWLLINDLDLSLSTNSTNRLHLGNDWHSNHSALYDVTNNAERIRIAPLPAYTLVSVHVRGSHVPVDGQQYALVVTGHFTVKEARECAGVHICPSACGGRGQCGMDGVCQCEEGWTGADCGQTSEVLPSCAAVSGVVSFGSWRFFRVDPQSEVVQSGQWRAVMERKRGDPDLYVDVGRFPSLTSFNLSDPGVGPRHEVAWGGRSESAVVYVGVFGYCCGESEFTLQLCSTAADAPPGCACEGPISTLSDSTDITSA